MKYSISQFYFLPHCKRSRSSFNVTLLKSNPDILLYWNQLLPLPCSKVTKFMNKGIIVTHFPLNRLITIQTSIHLSMSYYYDSIESPHVAKLVLCMSLKEAAGQDQILTIKVFDTRMKHQRFPSKPTIFLIKCILLMVLVALYLLFSFSIDCALLMMWSPHPSLVNQPRPFFRGTDWKFTLTPYFKRDQK